MSVAHPACTTTSAAQAIGIAGVFSHDPSSTAPNGYGDIDPNTPGEQDMPSISYGMSDAGLSSTDVGFWNSGNDDQGPTNTCTVKEQGVCVVAPNETAHPPTTYPNPLQTRGALIQFPISVDPVAFAYDPTYKKVADGSGNVTSYHFNIQFAHSDGSGGLRLDQPAYCTIFNGIAEGSPITNWNDSRLQALNGGRIAERSDRPELHVQRYAPDRGTWRQFGHDIDLHASSGQGLRHDRHQSIPTTSTPTAPQPCRQACRAAPSTERPPPAW